MKRTLLSVLWVLIFATLASGDPGISKEEYARRRATLMEKCGQGVVVVDAGKLIPGEAGLDANTPWFDFRYLTGIQPDNAVLVLVPSQKAVILFASGEKAKLAEETGISEILPQERFEDFAQEVLSAGEQFFVKRRGRSREIIEQARSGAAWLPGLDTTLSRMRVVKSEAELSCLRKAAEATNAAHVAALKEVAAGMNEKDLQKIIEDTFKKNGATGLAFPSIVGSGKNGTILHYMRNREEMKEGTLVVCDIGAEYKGYAADITRTLPVGGKFTELQRKAYQCVLDAQKAAENVLKEGVSWNDLDAAARAVFEERKMTKWSYAHAADMTVRHGLGHWVGLAVHDSGPYREPIPAGSVLTIEPGYYDKDEGFGIRIEDTYIVTKEGFERISAGSPREIEEIER